MADNVELNAGTGGAVIKTDDDGTAHWQYVKLAFGADNTQTIVGSTASNPLPVALSDTDNAVLDNIQTAVQLIDNAISGAGFNITQLGGAAVPIGAGTEAAALRVTLATDSTGVVSIDDNGASITVDNAGINTIAGAVSGTEMQVDVVAALPAGTNNIGDVDVATIAAGSNLIGDVGVSVRTSGGTTIFRSLDLDETEEEVKATAGQVYWIHAMNLTAAKLYLKFYNATAANVTVGTTTPVLTFPIATLGDTNGAGFVLSIPNGIAFGTAITAAVTTGIADSDTTGPAANGCVVNMGYA